MSCAELAERALAETEGEAQVSVTRARGAERTTQGGRPAGASSSEQLGVEIVCRRDGHLARAATSSPAPEALRDAARRASRDAEALAATAASPGEHPGFAEPAAGRPHEGFDLATARLDPAMAEEVLAATAGEGVRQACFGARSVEVAIAGSTGLRIAERATVAHLGLQGEQGAAASAAAGAASALDPAGLLARATRRAGATLAAFEPSSEHLTGPVVLGPEAVAAILRVLGASAFNGLLHAEGRGALAGRLGTRVAAAAINLSDSPRYASTLPRSYDADGVPKSPLPLIQDGVAHRVVHDRFSAARARGAAASTGHALRCGGAPTGPEPRNLVLVGGGAADEEDLASSVHRGVLVDRLHDVHVLGPARARFGAHTGGDTYAIEDGAIVARLPSLSVADSALALLATVEALGARARLVLDRPSSPLAWPTGVVCPPLRAAGLGLALAV